MPANAFQHDSWLELATSLHPDAPKLNRADFASYGRRFKLQYKIQVRNILQNQDLCITGDLSSNQHHKPIFCVTCCFITEEFERVTFVLKCDAAPHPHRAPNVKLCVPDYNVEFDQVKSVVADGAGNNEFSELILPDYVNEPSFEQHWCILHRLNLAMRDCNDQPWVRVMIGSLRAFLNHFKNSDFRRQLLSEVCAEVNCVYLQMKFPADTRFNYWHGVASTILSVRY